MLNIEEYHFRTGESTGGKWAQLNGQRLFLECRDIEDIPNELRSVRLFLVDSEKLREKTQQEMHKIVDRKLVIEAAAESSFDFPIKIPKFLLRIINKLVADGLSEDSVESEINKLTYYAHIKDSFADQLDALVVQYSSMMLETDNKELLEELISLLKNIAGNFRLSARTDESTSAAIKKSGEMLF